MTLVALGAANIEVCQVVCIVTFSSDTKL